MKFRISALWVIAAVVVLTSGCVRTLDGGMKFALPFSKDKITSLYERPVDQVYDAAKQVLEFNGNISGQNTIESTLTAKVNNRTVWVKCEEVRPGLTRVVTQARQRGGTGDIDLAAEIDKQIALRL